MYFKLRKDTINWFKDIRDSLKIDFDIYYFCLLAGLASGTIDPDPSQDSKDLVEYFPGDYSNRFRLLIGLLIREELRRFKVELNNHVQVRQMINRYINADSPSKLTDDGIKTMNAYASGGYQELLEFFPDRPRSMESFLLNYHKSLSEIIKKGKY